MQPLEFKHDSRFMKLSAWGIGNGFSFDAGESISIWIVLFGLGFVLVKILAILILISVIGTMFFVAFKFASQEFWMVTGGLIAIVAFIYCSYRLWKTKVAQSFIERLNVKVKVV